MLLIYVEIKIISQPLFIMILINMGNFVFGQSSIEMSKYFCRYTYRFLVGMIRQETYWNNLSCLQDAVSDRKLGAQLGVKP